MFRSRLAPSPTGYLHLGNARSFLLAWLQMRALGGEIILRIEDLDQARAVQNAAEAIVEDLSWLGLDWDNELTSEYFQSNRFELYRDAVATLKERGLLYECFCSRKELREIASAPHTPGSRYTGTCRDLTATGRAARWEEKDPSLRFRVEPGTVIRFMDLVEREQAEDIGVNTGDFIVMRADGVPSYQLGVVVDDIAMGITHVLRGNDLLASTPRQILLFQSFGATPPLYAHAPLILGPDSIRLAKRHGSVSIAELRAAGHSPERIVGWLAWSCGIRPSQEPCRVSELIEGFSLENITRQATVLPKLDLFA